MAKMRKRRTLEGTWHLKAGKVVNIVLWALIAEAVLWAKEKQRCPFPSISDPILTITSGRRKGRLQEEERKNLDYKTPPYFLAVAVALLVEKLPSMHENLDLISSTLQIRCGGTCLQSQHLRNRGGIIRNSKVILNYISNLRPAWATMKLCFKDFTLNVFILESCSF